MIIYKATNKVNGKIYIGQTIHSVNRRMGEHVHSTNASYFHNAIKKYGIENFSFEVIDTAETPSELNQKEKYWVSQYDAMNPDVGYNLTPGGDSNPMSSKAVKEAHDAKMRTDDVRSRISKSLKAYRKQNAFTEEHRKHLSESMRGNKNFSGHKRTIGAISKTIQALNKSVYCTDANGNFIRSFESIKSAVAWFNSTHNTDYSYKYLHRKIRKSCVESVLCYGLIWHYE